MPQTQGTQDNSWVVVDRKPGSASGVTPPTTPPASSGVSGSWDAPTPAAPVRTGQAAPGASVSATPAPGGWGVVSRQASDEQMLPETMIMTSPSGGVETVPREQIRQKIASGYQVYADPGKLLHGASGTVAPLAPLTSRITSAISTGFHNVVGAPGAIYHAFTDPLTEAEKQKIINPPPIAPEDRSILYNLTGPDTRIGKWAAAQNAKNVQEGNYPRLATAFDRLAIQPAEPVYQKSKQSAAEGKPLQSIAYSAASVLPGVGPWAASLGEKAASGDVAGALTEGATTIYGPKLVFKGVGAGWNKVTAPLRPSIIPIQGVDVPVLVGEASPETHMGRLQTSLKSQGVQSRLFNAVADRQQVAVQQVIDKVAADAGHLTPEEIADAQANPHPMEAGRVMRRSATQAMAGTYDMYHAIDASLTTDPSTASRLAQIATDAMNKAADSGAQLPEELTGRAANPQANAALEARAQRDFQQAMRDNSSRSGQAPSPQVADSIRRSIRAGYGLPPEPVSATSGSQVGAMPTQSYLLTKLELYRLARQAGLSEAGGADAYYRQIRALDAQMNKAIAESGNPALADNWKRATEQWNSGQARTSIAEALDKASNGTAREAQAPGVTPQAQTTSANTLVRELNELNKQGELVRAVGQPGATALRQVADLLDRMQDTNIGTHNFGLRGWSVKGVIWHTIFDAGKSIGAYPFVKLMTSDLKVAQMVNRMTAATTPAAATTAANDLRSYLRIPPAESTSTPPPVSATELRPLPSDFVLRAEPTVNGTDFTMHNFNDQQIGTMSTREHAPVNGRPAVEIGSVNLEPAARGAGRGQAFLDEAAQHIADQGTDFMVVYHPTPQLASSLEAMARRYPNEVAYTNDQWQWDLSKLRDRMQQEAASASTGTSSAADILRQQSAANMAGRTSPGVQMPTPPPSLRAGRPVTPAGLQARVAGGRIQQAVRAVPQATTLSGTQKIIAAAAVMTALKNGEIDQKEADQQIQRINGGGGRKMIRMPQDPRLSAQ